MILYVMIFVSFVIATIFALYFFHIFITPKKIEEIVRMIENGQTSAAIRKLNEMLEKDDRDSYAHYLLAKAYKLENNIQYAILEYRQVLKLAKYNEKVKEAEVRTILANIYKERGDFDLAEQEFINALIVEPTFMYSYNALLDMYQKMESPKYEVLYDFIEEFKANKQISWEEFVNLINYLQSDGT